MLGVFDLLLVGVMYLLELQNVRIGFDLIVMALQNDLSVFNQDDLINKMNEINSVSTCSIN